MDKERDNNGNKVLLMVIGVATLLVALVGATFAYFSASVVNQGSESMLVTTAVVSNLTMTGNSGINLQNIVPGQSDDSSFTITNPPTMTVDGDSVQNRSVMSFSLKLVVEENNFVTTTDSGAETDSTNVLQDQLKLLVGTGTLGQGLVEGVSTPNIQHVGFSDATENGGLTLNPANTSDPEFESGKYTGYYNVTDSESVSAGNEYTLLKDQILGASGSAQYYIKLYFADTKSPQNANQGKRFKAYFEVSNVKSINVSSYWNVD